MQRKDVQRERTVPFEKAGFSSVLEDEQLSKSCIATRLDMKAVSESAQERINQQRLAGAL